MTRIAITALLILLAAPAAAADLSGRARATDGDTIRIGATSIRIWGLAAPERSEPGGRQATAAMAELLAKGPGDLPRHRGAVSPARRRGLHRRRARPGGRDGGVGLGAGLPAVQRRAVPGRRGGETEAGGLQAAGVL